MKKIKFKIEYVPLSDAQVERHKNFDALMAAFAAHPKPGWKEQLKEKFFGNKLFVYAGGIITGAAISSLLWWNIGQADLNQELTAVPDSATVIEPTSPATVEMENATEPASEISRGATAPGASENENRVKEVNPPGNENLAGFTLPESNTESRSIQQNETQENFASRKQDAANNKAAGSGKGTGIAEQQGQLITDGKNEAAASDEAAGLAGETGLKTEAARAASRGENFAPDTAQKNNGEKAAGNMALPSWSQPDVLVSDTLVQSPDQSAAEITEPFSSLPKDSARNKFQLELPKIDLSDEWNATRNRFSKAADSIGSKTSALVAGIFDKDTTSQNRDSKTAIDSPTRTAATAPADTFKKRFAQVSLVTPLGSNGINGDDYVHHLSLNILQGYNGALNGAEFGGLANVEKGYVRGAQFGGLVNFAFGDVSGAQFAGLYNHGKNVNGFQGSGLVNTATGSFSGMQAGGIANFVRDTLRGFQAGGIANVAIANTPSRGWQAAGIANVNLGKNKGGQVAGIVNVANEQQGIQVGLINVAKKMDGFQLALINVTDSISGESLGLINISRNGQHHLDVFGSEILYASAGIKLGSPHLYSILAFGMAPTPDVFRMGLGAGIGWHQPLKKAFINVDGMCWTIHNDNFNDWEAVNLHNQLRLMAGYPLSDRMAVYAGPTANVHVYDPRYPSLAPYTIFQANSTSNYVDGWIGGVIGIQFF
jgi:hypothetical protein